MTPFPFEYILSAHNSLAPTAEHKPLPFKKKKRKKKPNELN